MLSDFILKMYKGEVINPSERLVREEERRFGKIGSKGYQTKKQILDFIIKNKNEKGILANYKYEQIGDILNLHKTTVGLHIREMERNGVLKCFRVSDKRPLNISVVEGV